MLDNLGQNYQMIYIKLAIKSQKQWSTLKSEHIL